MNVVINNDSDLIRAIRDTKPELLRNVVRNVDLATQKAMRSVSTAFLGASEVLQDLSSRDTAMSSVVVSVKPTDFALNREKIKFAEKHNTVLHVKCITPSDCLNPSNLLGSAKRMFTVKIQDMGELDQFFQHIKSSNLTEDQKIMIKSIRGLDLSAIDVDAANKVALEGYLGEIESLLPSLRELSFGNIKTPFEIKELSLVAKIECEYVEKKLILKNLAIRSLKLKGIDESPTLENLPNLSEIEGGNVFCVFTLENLLSLSSVTLGHVHKSPIFKNLPSFNSLTLRNVCCNLVLKDLELVRLKFEDLCCSPTLKNLPKLREMVGGDVATPFELKDLKGLVSVTLWNIITSTTTLKNLSSLTSLKVNCNGKALKVEDNASLRSIEIEEVRGPFCLKNLPALVGFKVNPYFSRLAPNTPVSMSADILLRILSVNNLEVLRNAKITGEDYSTKIRLFMICLLLVIQKDINEPYGIIRISFILYCVALLFDVLGPESHCLM